MQGGVVLFRGAGTAACQHLESDRSQANAYHLEAGTALAHFTVSDASGGILTQAELAPEAYAG